jgi:hypothetical protein
MQGARQTRRPPRPLLSWQRCLLIVSLAAGVALAIRYRGSWEPPLLAHARTAQAQLHAHYRSVEAALQQKLPVWQRTARRVLTEQRRACSSHSVPSPCPT